MSETKHPLLEGYTPVGGESITKPTYRPPDSVIEAFIEGIAKNNLFRDPKKPTDTKLVEPQDTQNQTKK